MQIKDKLDFGLGNNAILPEHDLILNIQNTENRQENCPLIKREVFIFL